MHIMGKLELTPFLIPFYFTLALQMQTAAMPIAVFSGKDSASIIRVPSIECHTDRTASTVGAQYHQFVVARLREEYGDNAIGSPPGGWDHDYNNFRDSASDSCLIGEGTNK